MAASDAQPEARGTLGTVRNAVLLLDLLSEGPAYQHLNDIAEQSGLSVATVHRLLRSLVLADLVEQDPRSARYGLGPGATRLSERYLGRLPVLGALAPYLVQLRDTVSTTVQVALLVRGSTVYVDRVDGPDGGLYRAAHRVRPALTTAAGRLLAAHADDAAWDLALHTADPKLREVATTERDTWRTAPYLHLAAHGTDTEDELAVRVTGGHGTTPAALTVSASPDRADKLARHLTQAAQAAGRTLGHE